MAELRFEEERPSLRPSLGERPSLWIQRPHWGAIWAGLFTFIAIWSVFGVLGLAIFGSAANPNNAAVSGGIGVGLAIWAVVLSIIAMYVAGRVTGGLAGLDRSANAVVHGMIMFGLSVAALLVLMAAGNTSATSVRGTTPDLMHTYSGLGWVGFFCLLLGWLAAMAGAATGGGRRIRTESTTNVQQMRPAA